MPSQDLVAIGLHGNLPTISRHRLSRSVGRLRVGRGTAEIVSHLRVQLVSSLRLRLPSTPTLLLLAPGGWRTVGNSRLRTTGFRDVGFRILPCGVLRLTGER